MTPQLNPVLLSEIRARTLEEVAKLPRTIGRYQIRGELGTGGMGIVFDAYDPSLERAVAIKVIHREKMGSRADGSDIIKRFEKEMRATSEIFHPNVVSILDAGVEELPTGQQVYYVMERVDGDSLEQLLRKCGTLSRRKGLEVAASVSRGLAAAHDKGIVHRDLKPSNILLPNGGEPRIADFGLCRFRDDGASLTDAGTILGSANYISPEQLRSEEVTGAADLFALGAILIRLFSGDEPFRADSVAAHFQRILADEPDGLGDLDPDVRELVVQLVSKDPNDRPASALEVAERLDELAAAQASSGGSGPRGDLRAAGTANENRGSGGTTATAEPPTSGAGGALSRSVAWVLAGLAALLVVAGIAGARNELVALDSVAETQWKQVENQLARQHELIPPLIQLTKKYTEYETRALQSVLNARQGYAEGTAGDRPAAAGRVERALTDLLLAAERYPNLKADAHYRALAFEIAGSKNRIAVERMRYNEAVGELNARLRQMPWSFLAGSMDSREFFNPTPEQLADPVLDL